MMGKGDKSPSGVKSAVIVGGTGQIGTAVTNELADTGYFFDTTWLQKDHPDVTNQDAFDNLPEEIHFGAYLPGLNTRKPTEKLTSEEWQHSLDINLNGAFNFAQAAFRALCKANGSSLCFFSSIFATHPYPEVTAYAASKAALEGLTRALAVEWGKFKIRVNCIRVGHLPSPLKTSVTSPHLLGAVMGRTPAGNLVEVADIAKVVSTLAESKSVTGAVIDVDCGYSINRYPLDD